MNISQAYKKRNSKGQILVITLVVLMIIAITIIGVITTLNRDTLQVSTSDKYGQIYAVTENELLRGVETYGLGYNINQLNSQGCSRNQSSTELRFVCDSEPTNPSNLDISNELIIYDTKNITELELRKDESYAVNLNGYNNDIRVTWDTTNTAVEFALTYSDNGVNQVRVIRDVYEWNSLYTSNGANNFTFTSNSATGTTFRISSISGLSGSYTTQNLIIYPRTTNANTVVTFSVSPTSYASFPYQMRVFESQSFDASDPNTPLVSLDSRISLLPQIVSLFDYALLTNGQVTL